MPSTIRNSPYYSKRQIINHIDSGKYIIDENALKNAEDDFGWDIEDIKSALRKLTHKHFHKSTEHYTNPSIKVDYYKAKGLMGEDVFTHFHIEDDILIIQSFKRK